MYITNNERANTMLEILTKSGAVIHVDEKNPQQAALLNIAVMALGGEAAQMELTKDVTP